MEKTNSESRHFTSDIWAHKLNFARRQKEQVVASVAQTTIFGIQRVFGETPIFI